MRLAKNDSDLDKYIKSHVPALYLLDTEKFKSESALIDSLLQYFTEQPHFKEQFESIPREFKESLILNYTSIMNLLSSIEAEYIDNAIDELWEGYQEDFIYAKYNKSGIINF